MGERIGSHIGVFVLSAASLIAGAIAWADDNKLQAAASTSANDSAIVCLHTEFLPWRFEDQIKYRLMRELGRQALLIAARDEMGLATRDETLGEIFPDSVTKTKQDLFVVVRSQYDGNVKFQLWRMSHPDTPAPSISESKRDALAILNQTEKLEPRIHTELCDMLRAQGYTGKNPPANEKNLPPDEIEGHLLEMNFVAQFAAVRAAHLAIAEKGQSHAWLGVLARGYANLALMTEHHWKSDSEAFTARALLYAQRLTAAAPDDSGALATRAYARAIVGLHGAALSDLQRSRELRRQHSEQQDLAAWTDVIEPYCSFQRDELHSLVQKRPSLRQLAQRLSFEQIRAFDDDRWTFDSAKETMSVCPDEYGIYAALTRAKGSLLGIVRTGAFYGPAALARFLPKRVAGVSGVPDTVRDAAKGVINAENEKASKDKNADDKSIPEKNSDQSANNSSGGYAAGTIPIVESLRAATRSGNDKGEPTWSALAELIFEEQFVQAVNYLTISLNATESSHSEEVQSICPAVKGHRFEPYIKAFAELGNTDAFYRTIGDMPILDARGNMYPMLIRIWPIDSSQHNRRGSEAAWYASNDTDLTFNGMLETYNALNAQFWPQDGPEKHQEWADDFKAISPHSPQALRIAIRAVDTPTFEQVSQWESQVVDDPHAYRQLGDRYVKLSRFEDAIRVYERSVGLSPTYEAYVGLANAYRSAGQENLWQPTLERFLKVESLGLEQASVRALIANDLINKNKFEEALPFAEAAAETYAGWALILASRVEEYLGHWDKSEKYIEAASTSYPSTGGDEWYFWCKRTGRGNVDEARKLVKLYLQAARAQNAVDGDIKMFTFQMCENEVAAAAELLKKMIPKAVAMSTPDQDLVRAYIQAAEVARALKDNDWEQQSIKEARKLINQFQSDFPKLGTIYSGICDVLEGHPPSKDRLAEIDKAIAEQIPLLRVNCQYFLGRAYDLAGNKELADKYWKECVTHGPFERYPATLAGKFLSDRNKTSR